MATEHGFSKHTFYFANNKPIANVSSSDLVETWRIYTNQLLSNVATANLHTVKTSNIAPSNATSDFFVFSANGSIRIPRGTTGERTLSEIGSFRYNTTTGGFEGYGASGWGSIGGGGGGGSGDVSNSYLTSTFTPNATFQSALSNTNSFIKSQLANTNSFIKSQLANTNLAIIDRIAVANVIVNDLTLQGSVFQANNIVTAGLAVKNDNQKYTVTVGTKTAIHPFQGGSSSAYFLNGEEAPHLILVPGVVYMFDQSDGTNSTHPLRFYKDANKQATFTDGVTTNGTAGSAGAWTKIIPTSNTITELYYQCSSHDYMGAGVSVTSGASSKYVQTGNLISTLAALTDIDANVPPATGNSHYLTYNVANTTYYFTQDLSKANSVTANTIEARAPFIEHGTKLMFNYEVGSNNNILSGGPVSIYTGVTLTIGANSTWTIA